MNNKDLHDKLFSYSFMLLSIILGLNVNRVYNAYSSLPNIGEPILVLLSQVPFLMALSAGLSTFIFLMYIHIKLHKNKKWDRLYEGKKLLFPITFYTVSSISIGFIPFFMFRIMFSIILTLNILGVLEVDNIESLQNATKVLFNNDTSINITSYGGSLLLIVVDLLLIGVACVSIGLITIFSIFLNKTGFIFLVMGLACAVIALSIIPYAFQHLS